GGPRAPRFRRPAASRRGPGRPRGRPRRSPRLPAGRALHRRSPPGRWHRRSRLWRSPALRRTLASGAAMLRRRPALVEDQPVPSLRCYTRAMNLGWVARVTFTLAIGLAAAAGCAKKPANNTEAGQVAAPPAARPTTEDGCKTCNG